jgi:hypothetical protein
MCIETDAEIVAFCNFWFILESNHCNFNEILKSFSSFIMLWISCVNSVKLSSPISLSTCQDTSVFPLAFLSFIS